MSARPGTLARMAIAIAGLTLTGCAVGQFIAGAPSVRTTAPRTALLERRCGGCHEVPDPAAMTRAEWLAGLERMKLRMKLPASEWDSLAALAPRKAPD